MPILPWAPQNASHTSPRTPSHAWVGIRSSDRSLTLLTYKLRLVRQERPLRCLLNTSRSELPASSTNTLVSGTFTSIARIIAVASSLVSLLEASASPPGPHPCPQQEANIVRAKPWCIWLMAGHLCLERCCHLLGAPPGFTGWVNEPINNFSSKGYEGYGHLP